MIPNKVSECFEPTSLKILACGLVLEKISVKGVGVVYEILEVFESNWRCKGGVATRFEQSVNGKGP
jgi:hypothetical protein